MNLMSRQNPTENRTLEKEKVISIPFGLKSLGIRLPLLTMALRLSRKGVVHAIDICLADLPPLR